MACYSQTLFDRVVSPHINFNAFPNYKQFTIMQYISIYF